MTNVAKYDGADMSGGGSGDLVDTHGHTVSAAEAADANFNAALPAASQATPVGNQQVRAETDAEVDAEKGL